VLHLPNGWTQALGCLFLVLALSVVVFFDSWSSMVDMWWRSKTYTHGFVIAPISAWLVWSRRAYYLHLSPSVSYRAFVAMLASGLIWLSADLSHVVVVAQLATVALLISGFWAVLGNAVALSLSFPLMFLFFMVPMGEELIPSLIEFTTTFTVKLLRLTGLPVYREGSSFTLTSGSWSVIDACSGIGYLIASVTLGFVFAYLNYAAYSKRALFMLLSIIVPIIANGFRAYLIVMIGHLSNMTLAVGVDHLIYGGVFFGLVMLLLFYLGSFWRDPPFTPISIVSKRFVGDGNPPTWLSAMLVVVFFCIWPPLSSWLIDKQTNTGLPAYVLNADPRGWHSVPPPPWQWQPQFDDAVAHKTHFYSDGSKTIGIYHASFGKEVQGVELVNAKNSLIRPIEKQLRMVHSDTARLPRDNNVDLIVNESLIKGSEGNILVMDWYQISDQMTTNRYWVKWRQLVKRLTGDATPELKVVLWIQTANKDYQPDENVLKSFLANWVDQNNVPTN
jgi:exosortase A